MSEINFEKIYDKYIDKIYRFVYVRVNSKEAAQDLSSETFTRSFEYFRKNPEKNVENVQAFLFRTASNLLTDFYRQKSRHDVSLNVGENNYAINAVVARDQHAEISIANSEQAKKIIAVLQDMESEQANVVMWYYVDDLPVREIAKITGRPEGTIRVMLHRGLNELRRLLL